MKLKTKREIKKELEYARIPLVNVLDTPRYDEALIKYLKDTIDWLDSLDDDDVSV